MKKPELLSPAGDLNAFYAAVNGGADAVYLGVEDFSARKRAKNFSLEDLKEALKIAKNRGIKVFITINTLIKDSEIESVINYINQLIKLEVDGLIIQDIGLLNILLDNKKLLEDHGVSLQLSTQASVYGNDGRDYFKDLGLDRIVIARETNINDFKNDQIENEVETKVFCHGALCYAYSGQCNFSSSIGKRSGNRGECAQPCRKFYTLSKDNKKLKEGFLLSTKELNTLKKADQFNNSNIDSIKIEGRMRSPEYVYAVTEAYRNKLDGKEYDESNIEATFSRDFTDGLIFGNRHNLSQENSKKRGVLIGYVGKSYMNNLELKLNKGVTLINGDGISFGNEEEGTYINKILNKKGEILKQGKNTVLIPYSKKIKENTPIFRSFDKEKIDQLRKKALKKPEINKKPVNFNITIKNKKEPRIIVKRDDYWISYVADFIPEKAKNKSLSKEEVKTQFSKLGQSKFSLAKIDIDLDDGLYISKKDLNNLRNKSLEKFAKEALKNLNTIQKDNLKLPVLNNDFIQREKPIYSIRFEEIPNYKDIKNLDVDEVILKVKNFNDLEHLKSLLINLKKENKRILLNTKAVFEKKDMDELKDSEFLDLIQSSLVDGLLVSNYEILNFIKGLDVGIEADKNLNIFNKYSTDFLKKQGFSSYIISDELSSKEIKELSKNSEIDTAQIVYGKRNLMISSNCVMDCAQCINCPNEGFYDMENKVGDKFKLKIEDKKNYIYQATPIYLPEALKEQKYIKKYIIDILDESPEEIVSIISDLKNTRNREGLKGRYLNGVI